MREIAKSAWERISGLRSVIARIDEHESLESLSLLQAADEKLEKATINLSIVGQVKAGKSTLINALTEIGDLLPTEVNPWTAVITNLHFGKPLRTPGKAQFTMFSEEEWARMVQGDSETRKLAEEFLPGFDSGILEKQVEEMQARARAQLGGMYQHLLGKVHSFSKVDRDILDRYVCAGDETAQGGPAGNSGKLSSITKSADIFLEAGPFCLPVTVADTPGINDPFLVRDEITTNYIKTADMSVVAISAHQPLNSADIALLKMLSRNASKKVTVFVNRCDELGASITDVPEILEALRERLASEVADASFTLCAGSAFWGHIALQGTDLEVAKALKSDAFKSLVNAGMVPVEGSDRERLASASGLDILRDVLSKAIYDGPVAELVADVAGQVALAIELVRSQIETQIRKEKLILEGNPDAIRTEAQSALQARRTEMVELLNAVTKIAKDEAPNLDASEAISGFAPKMREVVELYIGGECERLRAAIARDSAEGSWTFDYKKMRSTVDERMLTYYRDQRDELDGYVAHFALALNGKIAPVLGALKFGPLLESLPAKDLLPGFKPQSELVEIDLTRNRGWKFWQARRLDADEAMAALAGLIRAETRSAADETARVLADGLSRRSEAAQQAMGDVMTTLTNLFQSDMQSIDADLKSLAEGGGSVEVDQLLDQRRHKLERLQGDLTGLTELARALDAYLDGENHQSVAA